MRAILPLALTVILAGSTASGADVALPAGGHCFTPAQYMDWRKGGDSTIYLRANVDRFYRLDLMRACGMLSSPDPRLILRARAGATICSALDLDLRVTDGFLSPPEPCQARAMTELTPEQVAALPPKMRP